jgi:hypothetical protein
MFKAFPFYSFIILLLFLQFNILYTNLTKNLISKYIHNQNHTIIQFHIPYPITNLFAIQNTLNLSLNVTASYLNISLYAFGNYPLLYCNR